MRRKADILPLLANPGVIAVVRASRREQVIPLSEALVAGGVIAVEVTLSTPDAIAAIREAKQMLGDRAVIGVGTVLDADTCRRACEAGAEFVVSPILRPEIAAAAREFDRPVMLGAYTPTEAQLAHEAGSDFIKIFPSDGLGAPYIKAIRAPLPHLQIIPTGIARAEEITALIQAGCVAVGLGSLLLTKEILQTDNWPELTKLAQRFVAQVRAARTA
jgi:2-dehydro-3-deoxyphosphogluconate aldolase / (4S)-4-hydroxy-2-oxoglutarate aldolase